MTSAFVSGYGWVTPLGRELEPIHQAVLQGLRTPPAEVETGYGGTMPILRVAEDSVRDAASFPRLRRSSAISVFAVAAAMDAVASAGLDAEKLRRTALVFTSSDGGVVYTRRFYAEIVERNMGAGSPLLFPETVYNASASHIAARLGITGEALTLVGDSTAGIAAVQTAMELLTTGEADHCLIVGAQEIDGTTWEAYARWKMVAAHAGDSIAFLSEGAAALVLSREGSGPSIRQIHPGECYSSQADATRRFDRIVSSLTSPEIDLIVTGASGSRLDEVEQSAFRRYLPEARQIHPKFTLGESGTCSTLQHIGLATHFQREKKTGAALVSACGFNQQIAALILT